MEHIWATHSGAGSKQRLNKNVFSKDPKEQAVSAHPTQHTVLEQCWALPLKWSCVESREHWGVNSDDQPWKELLSTQIYLWIPTAILHGFTDTETLLTPHLFTFPKYWTTPAPNPPLAVRRGRCWAPNPRWWWPWKGQGSSARAVLAPCKPEVSEVLVLNWSLQ